MQIDGRNWIGAVENRGLPFSLNIDQITLIRDQLKPQQGQGIVFTSLDYDLKSYLEAFKDDFEITFQPEINAFGLSSFVPRRIRSRHGMSEVDQTSRQGLFTFQDKSESSFRFAIILIWEKDQFGFRLNNFIAIKDTQVDIFNAHFARAFSKISKKGAYLINGYRYESSYFDKIDNQQFIASDAFKNHLLQNTVFLLNPANKDKAERLGIPLRRGILMQGAPGTGKTLATRFISKNAIEQGINVYYIEPKELGSPEPTLEELLEGAMHYTPCIIILDDIDLFIGEKNSAGYNPKNIATLLHFMDGFDSAEGFVVIGTTNFPERLHPALRRYGRFDVPIEFEAPSLEQKLAFFDYSFSGIRDFRAEDHRDLFEPFLDQSELQFSDLVEVARLYKMHFLWQEFTVDQYEEKFYEDLIKTCFKTVLDEKERQDIESL